MPGTEVALLEEKRQRLVIRTKAVGVRSKERVPWMETLSEYGCSVAEWSQEGCGSVREAGID